MNLICCALTQAYELSLRYQKACRDDTLQNERVMNVYRVT